MDYSIRRVARDCPHNADPKNARSLIYDFDVVVGGEVVATWHRDYRGKGYELFDPNFDEVLTRAPTPEDYVPTRTLLAKAAKKDDFVPILDGLFASGRIPTAEESRARLAGWGRALLEARDVKDAASRSFAARNRADDLLALVERFSIASRPDASMRAEAAELVASIRRAAEESIANARELYPFRSLEVEAVAAFEASIEERAK